MTQTAQPKKQNWIPFFILLGVIAVLGLCVLFTLEIIPLGGGAGAFFRSLRESLTGLELGIISLFDKSA